MVTSDSGIVLSVRYTLRPNKHLFVAETACVLLRYDMRLKKQVGIEHVIQRRIVRWQHVDSLKLTLCFL
jgi:non-homologous end joining protein Ku